MYEASLKTTRGNDKIGIEEGRDRMSTTKLTDAEAHRLIEMLKHSLISELNLPTHGKTIEFDVAGDTKRDVFTINMYRGKLNHSKYNIGARIKKDGILLLELHINPTTVHYNPNGEKIEGSHWHIYSEEYGRTYTFPATDIENENFVENTIFFLEKFNVIEKPNIAHQLDFL